MQFAPVLAPISTRPTSQNWQIAQTHPRRGKAGERKPLWNRPPRPPAPRNRPACSSLHPKTAATSIDTPLDDTDGGSATLGDLQEDPAAAQAFQTAEDELYTEELHAALEEALNKLTAKQADVVRRHYFGGKCLSEIAREDNTTRNAPYNHEQAAFLALRRNPALARWHDDILSAKAWTGTGWNAWNRYGSVEERVTEYIEKKEAERREFIEQRRREDEALLEESIKRFKVC